VAVQDNGTLVGLERGYRFLPRNREIFSYDFDGNLLSDGRWTMTWDAENRASSFVDSSGVAPPCKSNAHMIHWPSSQEDRRTTDRKFVYDG